MEPSKHATDEPRIPSVEPNNTEASSSAASQASAPSTAHSVSEATSSSDTSPVESTPPSKPESAPADPAPPSPGFNPEDWSAPIAHTYTGTTVLNFPDDMHTVTIQGARFLTHIYTCPVSDLDWDKAIANMLQWCGFEQHRQYPHSPSSQGHPAPIHGLLKCPPIVQIFTSLHPSTFPTIPSRLTTTGKFVRYQPAQKSHFHIPHDLRELPELYHGIIQHEEPDDSTEDVPNLSWLFVEQYAPKKWRWYLNRRTVWEATRPRLSEEQMEIW